MLDDSFASMTLKRRLDAGEISMSDTAPGTVAGRVAIADIDTAASALAQAAQAAEQWRQAPVSVRVDEWLELQCHAVSAVRIVAPLVVASSRQLWKLCGYRPVTSSVTAATIRFEQPQPAGRRRVVRRAQRHGARGPAFVVHDDWSGSSWTAVNQETCAPCVGQPAMPRRPPLRGHVATHPAGILNVGSGIRT